MTITSPIQHRRGSTESLEQSDYIPAAGEIVIATDTGQIKAGDGIHTWHDLPSGNQPNTELEARIAAIEHILRERNVVAENELPQEPVAESELDKIFDNIFAGNISSESDTQNNNDFDNAIDSIFQS